MAYFQVRFLLVSGRVYNHLEIHQINIQHVHMLQFSEILFVLLYLVTWSLLLTFHFSKAYQRYLWVGIQSSEETEI